ncbi:YbhB/YbcL family Raf kinase inhibitor-like protein [Streptomyces sp. NPDC007896]|uniref:YbhB/YbcL family Raf kinase inhibitor-like protein n=1 Tax=Streptomyces sp. NPDC007896 TaxID=3364784 RepID=UPI0036E6035C
MTSPYDTMPAVPEFAVRSADVADGAPLPVAHFAAMSGAAGAEDRSPQLSWDGFPAATRSFVVTMYDPDAPTPSGFWHWAVADIAADVTSLDAGAGTPGNGGLPDGAFHVSNDVRATAYVGAAPPPGTGKHRYYIAVNALDVPSVTDLGITSDSTPAALSFFILQHTLARAVLVPWAGE